MQWFERCVIKNNSFWSLNIPQGSAWCVPKILNSRHEALRQVKYQVGINSQFLFWHDPWVDGSILARHFDPSIIYTAQSSYLAKVCDYLQDQCWNLPLSNHMWITEMRQMIEQITLAQRDSITWDGFFKNMWTCRPSGAPLECKVLPHAGLKCYGTVLQSQNALSLCGYL